MPDKPRQNSKEQPISDEEIDECMRQALIATGRILPQTDDEIAATEEMVAKDESELPPSLRKAPTGPRPVRKAAASSFPIPLQTDFAENLAWAARNGGELTPEVVERMRADRETAEKRLRSKDAK